jgi:DNA-binding MarR family transcriptional regulator
MPARGKSSDFTISEEPFGPPLIGALLRTPWEAVQRRILQRLHDEGFEDFDAAHLVVFTYPGPQGTRPTELATRLRMSKQALNYLLGELQQRGYLERRPDPENLRSKRIVLTPRGTATIPVIRQAVAEIEAEWGTLLGSKRFAEFRGLLAELNASL